MSEPFEIGIALALDDGVAAGIERARQEMARLHHVLNSGGVPVRQLRETALRAVAPARTREPLAEPLGVVADAVSPVDPDPSRPVRQPARVPPPADAPAPPVPVQSVAPQPVDHAGSQDAGEWENPLPRHGNALAAAPPTQTAPASPDGTVARQPAAPQKRADGIAVAITHSPEPPQASFPRAIAPAAPHPQAEPVSASYPAPSPAAGPVAQRRPQSVTVAALPAAGVSLPPGSGVPSQPAAPAAPGQRSMAPARAMPSAPDPADEDAGTAHADPLRAAQTTQAAAAQMAASAPAGPTEGDVFLDGVLVGRWMSRHLSREAGRAPAGPTGFDARRGRLLPGPTVGG